MKAKMDPEMMKEFALNHAEKAIFAIFVLIFCSMVWSSAFSLKGIDATPEQLKQRREEAEKRIIEYRKIHVPVVDYQSLAKATTQEVSIENLQTNVPWKPTIWNDRKKREQPLVYTIESLMAIPGRWRVPYRQETPTGGTLNDDEEYVQRSSTQGVHGIILLGAIPYGKQQTAFEEALGKPAATARTVAKRDEPTYHLYDIQRAEVPDNWDGNAASLKWDDFKVRKTGGLFAQNLKILKTIQDIRSSSGPGSLGMPISSRDTVEDERAYVPPTLMRRDESAAAVARRDTVIDERGLVPDTYLTLMNPLPPVDTSGYGSTTDWLTTLKFPAGIGIGQPVKARRGAAGATAVETPAEESVFVEEELATTRVSYATEQLKPTRLFSYVDYTVEPGKTYIYRVKLELHNPNYLFQPTQLVANEEITRTQYLPTTWSEASQPVTIGPDISILAAGAEVLAGDKTPSPALMLVQFDTATGYELACRFNKIGMWSGDSPEELQKLSTRERRKRIEETKDLRTPFLNGMLLDLKAEETMMRPLSTGGSYSSYSNTQQAPIIRDYPTNYILLDTKLPKTEVVPEMKESEREKNLATTWDYSAIYAPTRMLLLETTPDGKPLRMVIQSEVENYEEVYARGVEPQRSSTSAYTAPTPTKSPGRTNRQTPRSAGGGRFGGAQLD